MAAAPLPLDATTRIPQTNAGGSAVVNNSAAPVSAIPGLVPMGTTQANPYAAPTATSVTPGSQTLNPTIPGSGAVQNNGINWNDGSNTVVGDLKDTYGAGTGTAIGKTLQGLGTSTDSAVQATIANTQLAADKQFGNIQSQEAAAGITPNSSTAALAAGDFYTGVNSQLQQTISGMELGEEDTLLQTLLGTGKDHGADESTFDAVLNGFSDAGQIFGDVASAVAAVPV